MLSHGDWSPDQVLVDGGAVRIVDLDRVCTAPPERDLGSWLASGGPTAMLEGFADAGGGWDERALGAWRALAGLERAAEPFRRGVADWPASVAARLASAEEALA
nr:phosphotransferase [Agrococcus sp. SL85]